MASCRLPMDLSPALSSCVTPQVPNLSNAIDLVLSPPPLSRTGTRMSLLRGIQRSALGGAAAAARGRLRSRSSSSLFFLSFLFLFLFLSGGALLRCAYATVAGTSTTTTTGQTPPDLRAETRPASARERDAQHDLASPSRPMYGGIVDAPGREKNPDAIDLARFTVAEHNSNAVRLDHGLAL